MASRVLDSSIRDQTITGLVSAREKILELAQLLPQEKRSEIFLGIWSAKDLLAHLVGWDYANMDSVHDIRAGKSPRIFEHYDKDWASFNARLVEQYKRENWKELIDAVQVSHNTLIEFLKHLAAEDFEKDFGVRSPRGRNITIAAHLQAEIDDEQIHYQQMKEWFK